MPATNKRRKTNNYEASPKKVRSLDYFFGKQREKDVVETTASSNEAEAEALSDEALARKLQAEWDAQDREQQASSQTRSDEEKALLDNHHHDGANTPASGTTTEKSTIDEKSLGESEQLPIKVEEKPRPFNPFAAMGKNTLSLQSATADDDSITYEIPFDESPLTFDPQKYTSGLQKQWAAQGGKATYALLTHCFIMINSTSSRIKIVDTLVNALRVIIESDPESLLPAVWLATNSISPPYINLELGLGGSAISKALKKVCGLDNQGLKKLSDKHGDAGDVAFEAKKRQSLTLRKPKPLTIASVYESLHKIANAKGHGSVEAKQRIVERLVQDARGAEESRYIVRTLVQHLRIGAVKTTMLIALSRAFLLSKPPGAEFAIRDRTRMTKLSKQELADIYAPAEELVKACFARRPNYNDLVPTLLEIGISREELLLRCGLAMHIPLRPMLGGITRDLGEMLMKLEGKQFTCEYKYDGQRAQVHCDDKGKVTIFSRHLEVMTDKYPDLVALVPRIRGEGVRSFIIEGEVVAIDKETGKLQAFQVLSNRARKDVVIGSVKVDVCLFAFDLMYLNGEELLNRSLRERRSLLRSLFVELPHHFTWVKNIDATSADEEAVSEFFTQALADKCEGFMAKVLDNPPGIDVVEADLGIGNITPPPPLPAIGSRSSAPPTPTSKRRKKSTTKSTKAATQRSKPSSSDEEGKDATTKNDNNVENRKAPLTSSRRKPLLATYTPDKRQDAWLKVKKDYNTSASETLDLIPIGAWHGQGRKAKWWSPILLAARNEETGQLEAVTKCMSGFSDKFYIANREKYDDGDGDGDDDGDDDDDDNEDDDDENEDENDRDEEKEKRKKKKKKKENRNNITSKPSYISYTGPPPAVWFAPQEVWEISFADITSSPTYTAAMGLAGVGGQGDGRRGLSTRFPRFLRVREDKGVDEASSTRFLAALYRKQESGVGASGAGKGDMDDEMERWERGEVGDGGFDEEDEDEDEEEEEEEEGDE